MGATLSWAFKLRLDQITAVAIETAMQAYNIFIVIITIFVITLLLDFLSSFIIHKGSRQKKKNCDETVRLTDSICEKFRTFFLLNIFP